MKFKNTVITHIPNTLNPETSKIKFFILFSFPMVSHMTCSAVLNQSEPLSKVWTKYQSEVISEYCKKSPKQQTYYLSKQISTKVGGYYHSPKCGRAHSHYFCLLQAAQGCACLMHLVHHTTLFYVWVYSLKLYMLQYYSIDV